MVRFIVLLLAADVKQVLPDLHSNAALPSFTPPYFPCINPHALCLSLALLFSLTVIKRNVVITGWQTDFKWHTGAFLFCQYFNQKPITGLYKLGQQPLSPRRHFGAYSYYALLMRESFHCSKYFVCIVAVGADQNHWQDSNQDGLLSTGILRHVPILPNDPWCADCLSFFLRETID